MKAPPVLSWRVWRWPVALNVITIVGLIAPLIGDGYWDVVSWVVFGLLVAVSLWYGRFRGYPSSGKDGSVRSMADGS